MSGHSCSGRWERAASQTKASTARSGRRGGESAMLICPDHRHSYAAARETASATWLSNNGNRSRSAEAARRTPADKSLSLQCLASVASTQICSNNAASTESSDATTESRNSHGWLQLSKPRTAAVGGLGCHLVNADHPAPLAPERIGSPLHHTAHKESGRSCLSASVEIQSTPHTEP
jgi:hypothetical protein